MSIHKTELIIAMLHERGNATENAKEAAEREYQQALGATRILKVAQGNLSQVVPAAKEELQQAGCDLKQIEIAVRQIEKCVASLVSMQNTAQVNSYKLLGRVECLRDQVTILDKEKKAEQAKLHGQREALEQSKLPSSAAEKGAPGRRAPGMHPGPTLKEQRRHQLDVPATMDSLPAESASKEDKPAKPAKKKATKRKARKQPKAVNGRAQDSR